MRPSEKAAKRLIAGAGRCRRRRPARCQRRRQSPRPARPRRRGWARVPPGPARPGPALPCPALPCPARPGPARPGGLRGLRAATCARPGSAGGPARQARLAGAVRGRGCAPSSGARGERRRARRIAPGGVACEQAVSPGRKAKALGHHGVTIIGKQHFPTGMGKFGGGPRY
ncbi:translation initiation factor IF-2-like [Oenanthe melanoleuca]|uniref:translation initiation factor IF-2-like n=1 Tax=Oenanthe melanoleuca TaxID=2939378 RepID=UPI0024C1EDFA|nr:translation initiation factor IF-2-like [Oenanthe melanoleuca]